ncbi:hypothetical protein SDC9_160077 [bioreactor metagenome]|uniref:Uncharacterized protein n=1 Tax=bioreactor metagenome TaxID=1076179 RepID=A0A645FEM7_9ZZZZ
MKVFCRVGQFFKPVGCLLQRGDVRVEGDLLRQLVGNLVLLEHFEAFLDLRLLFEQFIFLTDTRFLPTEFQNHIAHSLHLWLCFLPDLPEFVRVEFLNQIGVTVLLAQFAQVLLAEIENLQQPSIRAEVLS